ncbi:taurine ABC transporter permease, partial [Burkholderia glumae]|nr:taurine ABC transporter permease [Burkholderia glumae]
MSGREAGTRDTAFDLWAGGGPGLAGVDRAADAAAGAAAGAAASAEAGSREHGLDPPRAGPARVRRGAP